MLSQLQHDLKKPVPLYVGGVLLGLAIVLFAVSFFMANGVWMQAGAGLLLLCGGVLLIAGIQKQRKLKNQIHDLLQQYRGIPEDQWTAAAEEYAQQWQLYTWQVENRQQELEEINRSLEENADSAASLTDGVGLVQFEEQCRQHQQAYAQLQERQRMFRQTEQMLQALSEAGKQAGEEQTRFVIWCY